MSYWGRILWVDLTNKKFWDEKIEERIYKKYLGGYGLALKLSFERQKKGVDSLAPENILSFTPGLLTGTGAYFSGRFMVAGKSPATLGWGDSNSGGKFGNEIKRTGYDGIFFKGKSKEPVYFVIDKEKKEIRDAKKLWGKDTIETEDMLYKELGKDFKIAEIGKGGENLSFIAGIVHDKGRIAARMGLGAVMGSKKLKAIALRGQLQTPIANKESMLRINEEFLAEYKKLLPMTKNFTKFKIGEFISNFGVLTSKAGVWIRMIPDLFKILMRWSGTPGWAAWCMNSGDTPIKNWKGSYKDFPTPEKLTDDSVLKYQKRRYACSNCPLGCGGLLEVNEGPYKLEMHKPEYESLASIGALNLCDDLPTVLRIIDLCNREGLDTISLGSILAFTIECFEKGILDEKAIGFPLGWGDGKALLKLTEQIIERRGIGDILAEGVKEASEKIGKNSNELAMETGGIELAMHDPRADPGYGISYQFSPTPGKHMTSIMFQDMKQLERFKGFTQSPALYRKEWKYTTPSIGRNTAIGLQYYELYSCAGICTFGPLTSGSLLPIKEWINAVTGWELDYKDYLNIGKRILTLKQLFNRREGVPKRELPKRVRGIPPLKEGNARGVTLNMELYKKEFYEELGWDEEGKPKAKTLDQLDLARRD
jgi:aldehyde:ferredoxin oxidoreductase